MIRRFLILALIAALFIADPSQAHANAATIVNTFFQAAATAVSFIPGIGPILAAVISLGGSLITQALFGANQTSGSQREHRTRKFDPHPPFRFAFGFFPQEGSVVFHYAEGQRYYVAYLLNSIPSADDCIQRIEINDGIRLDIPGFFGPAFADYNGVPTLQDIYDMQLGAGAQDPAPYGLSDAPDIKFWCGLGDHTQAPQQWLDEIGEILQASDIWKGSTVLFARFVDDNQKFSAQRYPLGRPPPLTVLGKWAKLYDPRKDSDSGVPGAVGSHSPDDRTTWEYSNNPALAGLMLVMHEFALGFDRAMIPVVQWSDAATQLEAAQLSDSVSADVVRYLPDHETAANLSTDITDLASGGAENPHVLTYGGNAKNVTSDADFSTLTAIEFDGTGDTLSRTYSIDFRTASVLSLDTDEFCFEMECKFLSAGDGDLYTRYDADTNRRFWLLRRVSGALNFTGSDDGIDPIGLCNLSGGTVADNTKYHVAVSRENGFSATPGQEDIIRLFLDGVLVDSVQVATAAGFFADGNVGPMFGDRFSGGGDLHGRIANVRIVVGAPVRTANFTPPTAPLSGESVAFGCDGVVLIEDRELSLLDPVLSCMAGHLDTTDGLLGIRAGVWSAPTRTLSQPIGDEIDIKGARDGGFDTLRAKFIWPGADWEETDGPGYVLRSGSRVHPLHLPLVSSHEQAARLEKINALRAEPNRVVTALWDGREADVRLGERVSFSLAGFARAASTYVVDSKSLITQEADDGFEVSTRLTLVEDLEATYAWTTADYTPPARFSAPDPIVPSLGGPSSVVIAQNNYRPLDSGGVAIRLKITITITEAVSQAAASLIVEVDDGSGFAHFTIIPVVSGQTEYVVYLDPAVVGVTYTVRARTSAPDSLGESDWVVSNTLTIVSGTLDYASADYSGEYA